MKKLIFPFIIFLIAMIWIIIYCIDNSSDNYESVKNITFSDRYNPPDSAKIFPNYILEIYRGDTIIVINLNFK
jgi:hypothetical protein